MYTVEVNRTARQMVRILNFFGIWEADNHHALFTAVKQFCLSVLYILYPIFLASNAFLCEDRIESIYSAQVSLSTSLMCLKCLYMIYGKREMMSFLYDRSICHTTEDQEEFDLINHKLERFMKFIRVYITAVATTSFLGIIVKLPFLSFGEKQLPMFISLSWNDSEIVYWVAYGWLSFIMTLSIAVVMFHILLWYIMLNCSIAYQSLGNKFRNLGKRSGSIARELNFNAEKPLLREQSYVDELIALVKAHRNLNE